MFPNASNGRDYQIVNLVALNLSVLGNGDMSAIRRSAELTYFIAKLYPCLYIGDNIVENILNNKVLSRFRKISFDYR